jgi:hypothetical protein
MNKSRTTKMLGAALLLIAFGGCAREIIVRDRPPAARVEVIEARPSPAHVWIAGHWNWDGEWVWIKGHWEVPPRERAEWIPGHWVERPRGWVWEEGHWRD